MTVGDWSAKIWMDDLKTPLIRTKFHNSYLTDGCFSPTRVGAFFLTRKVANILILGWMVRCLGLFL
jgi:dynein intermediate chain 2